MVSGDLCGGYSTDVAADWTLVEAHLQRTYRAIAAILNATPSPHLEVVT